MRKLFLSSFFAASCFQAIPFPGQQAEIDSDAVLDFEADAVDEAIFAELEIQGVNVDQDLDGVPDFGVSLFLVVAANLEAEVLCEEAQNANNLTDLAEAFDDAIIAGSFVAKAEPFNQANGFNNGEEIAADLNNGFAVFSFLTATQAGNLEVQAEAFGDIGNFEFEDLNNLDFSGGFDDALEFELAQDNIDPLPAGPDAPNLDPTDIEGIFFKASPCNMDNLMEDFLLRRLGLQSI